jgi:hypothetical protein
MTADTHEAALARLREAYAALPPGAPVRLAKSTSNLFRFREATQHPDDAAGRLRVRPRAARRSRQPDRLCRSANWPCTSESRCSTM